MRRSKENQAKAELLSLTLKNMQKVYTAIDAYIAKKSNGEWCLDDMALVDRTGLLAEVSELEEPLKYTKVFGCYLLTDDQNKNPLGDNTDYFVRGVESIFLKHYSLEELKEAQRLSQSLSDTDLKEAMDAFEDRTQGKIISKKNAMFFSNLNTVKEKLCEPPKSEKPSLWEIHNTAMILEDLVFLQKESIYRGFKSHLEE